MKKSADFFCLKKSADFFVCVEIVWWDTSFTLISLHVFSYVPEGVYPQSDGSFAIVDIDASKGFVNLWEQLALAIFGNFDVKKTTEMAFDQDLTCLIFPFRWAGFPLKIGRNAHWEHLCSMDFDDFSTIYLLILF